MALQPSSTWIKPGTNSLPRGQILQELLIELTQRRDLKEKLQSIITFPGSGITPFGVAPAGSTVNGAPPAYTSIQAAMTAANAAKTTSGSGQFGLQQYVYIAPGTYTENLTQFYAGVHLVGLSNGQAETINIRPVDDSGQHIINVASGGDTVDIYIWNITFQSRLGSAVPTIVQSGSATILWEECAFYQFSTLASILQVTGAGQNIFDNSAFTLEAGGFNPAISYTSASSGLFSTINGTKSTCDISIAGSSQCSINSSIITASLYGTSSSSSTIINSTLTMIGNPVGAVPYSPSSAVITRTTIASNLLLSTTGNINIDNCLVSGANVTIICQLALNISSTRFANPVGTNTITLSPTSSLTNLNISNSKFSSQLIITPTGNGIQSLNCNSSIFTSVDTNCSAATNALIINFIECTISDYTASSQSVSGILFCIFSQSQIRSINYIGSISNTGTSDRNLLQITDCKVSESIIYSSTNGAAGIKNDVLIENSQIGNKFNSSSISINNASPVSSPGPVNFNMINSTLYGQLLYTPSLVTASSLSILNSTISSINLHTQLVIITSGSTGNLDIDFSSSTFKIENNGVTTQCVSIISPSGTGTLNSNIKGCSFSSITAGAVDASCLLYTEQAANTSNSLTISNSSFNTKTDIGSLTSGRAISYVGASTGTSVSTINLSGLTINATTGGSFTGILITSNLSSNTTQTNNISINSSNITITSTAAVVSAVITAVSFVDRAINSSLAINNANFNLSNANNTSTTNGILVNGSTITSATQTNSSFSCYGSRITVLSGTNVIGISVTANNSTNTSSINKFDLQESTITTTTTGLGNIGISYTPSTTNSIIHNISIGESTLSGICRGNAITFQNFYIANNVGYLGVINLSVSNCNLILDSVSTTLASWFQFNIYVGDSTNINHSCNVSVTNTRIRSVIAGSPNNVNQYGVYVGGGTAGSGAISLEVSQCSSNFTTSSSSVGGTISSYPIYLNGTTGGAGDCSLSVNSCTILSNITQSDGAGSINSSSIRYQAGTTSTGTNTFSVFGSQCVSTLTAPSVSNISVQLVLGNGSGVISTSFTNNNFGNDVSLNTSSQASANTTCVLTGNTIRGSTSLSLTSGATSNSFTLTSNNFSAFSYPLSSNTRVTAISSNFNLANGSAGIGSLVMPSVLVSFRANNCVFAMGDTTPLSGSLPTGLFVNSNASANSDITFTSCIFRYSSSSAAIGGAVLQLNNANISVVTSFKQCTIDVRMTANTSQPAVQISSNAIVKFDQSNINVYTTGTSATVGSVLALSGSGGADFVDTSLLLRATGSGVSGSMFAHAGTGIYNFVSSRFTLDSRFATTGGIMNISTLATNIFNETTFDAIVASQAGNGLLITSTSGNNYYNNCAFIEKSTTGALAGIAINISTGGTNSFTGSSFLLDSASGASDSMLSSSVGLVVSNSVFKLSSTSLLGATAGAGLVNFTGGVSTLGAIIDMTVAPNNAANIAINNTGTAGILTYNGLGILIGGTSQFISGTGTGTIQISSAAATANRSGIATSTAPSLLRPGAAGAATYQVYANAI